MHLTVKTSGSPDEQAGQICSAIEAAKDDIRILKEDNSFRHAFGNEEIWSYYIEDPSISVSVKVDGNPNCWMDIIDELTAEGFEFNIVHHTVTIKMIDYTIRKVYDFDIEFELHLKDSE